MELLILDRDGVINEESGAFVRSVKDWRAIPGSLEAIAHLSHSGYRVVVASNQSGLARGLFDIEALNDIHALMHRSLADLGGQVEAIFFCPHGPGDGCECRKPGIGMYLDIAHRLRLDLEGIYMVGDRADDIAAARAVNARPVLVRTGHGAAVADAAVDLAGVEIYDDLAAFADHLLARPAD